MWDVVDDVHFAVLQSQHAGGVVGEETESDLVELGGLTPVFLVAFDNKLFFLGVARDLERPGARDVDVVERVVLR